MQFTNETLSTKTLLFFLVTLCFGFLTGCSTFKSEPVSPESGIQPQPLLSNYWSMNSKIGILTEQDKGSAQLSWHQMGNKYVIQLTGPLGKVLGSLESDGEKVTLTSNDGSVQTAQNEEQLVLATIGKPLPIKQMQFWIKGIKAPFYPIEPISASADAVEFIQKDWHVSMSGFHSVEGYKLPKKLTLKYPGHSTDSDAVSASNKDDIQLKIIIKQWKLPVETAY